MKRRRLYIWQVFDLVKAFRLTPRFCGRYETVTMAARRRL